MGKIKKTELKDCPTRMVNIIEKPIKDILYYLTDDNFIECLSITRTNSKKFTAKIILKKATPEKKII